MSILELNSISRKISDTEEQLAQVRVSEGNELLQKGVEQQLRKRLDFLYQQKDEIEKMQYADTISLRIYGEDIAPGRISSKVLANMLQGFQNIAESVANTLINNSSRGKFSRQVKEITDFQIVSTFAGSFGLVMEKTQDHNEISAYSSTVGALLNQLFSIFEHSSDSQELLDCIAPFGSRTINHYLKWMSNMKEDSANIELMWRNKAAEERRLDISSDVVDNIIRTLESVGEVQQEDITVNAVLTGINIRNGTFEIQAEDGALIKGKAILETLISASESLGKEITAHLIKSTLYSKTNIANISWYLSSI